MRLLHTSDWHIGRGLHGVSLLAEQARFLRHLAEVIRDESVDLLVVSGDVYDRALPPLDAVTVLDEGLDAIAETGVAMVVTSGNHDSAQRLGFGRRRLARAGLHLRTRAEEAVEPVVLHDGSGPVACFAIPYLEPALVAPGLGVARSHEAVLTELTRRIRGAARAGGFDRVVVSAHAFVAGATPSASERDIRVGGVDRTSLAPFQGFSYTALGHLHAPQVLTDTVRYSGSPLPYSFAEADQVKGSWLVDLTGSQVRARFVEAPRMRPLATLRGPLEEVLGDPGLAAHEGSFCHVVLTDQLRPRAPMERLRRRFPHTLVLSFEPDGMPDQIPALSVPVPGRGDEEICLDFLRAVRGHGESADERRLVWQAVGAVRVVEDA